MHLPLRKSESMIRTGIVLSGFWVSSVLAQVTSAAGSTPPKLDDKPVELSPFIVSTEKDTGYIAADTLNAGRLSTNLLMTPGNIDVMTRDFINDLGVFNIDEASGWLTNSRPLETGAIEGNSMNPGSFAQQDSGTNVSLRGVGANPSTRNYFTSAATPKEYNVERVESARGPNAILYGEGGPGGSVNYITKRAQDRNFTTMRLRFDDNWSKSVAWDINRKLTDKLDVRYNVNLLDKRYFLDRVDFKEFDNAINLTYRPFENTVVSVDVDLTHNTRPGMITSYGEQYSQWDHVPVVGKLAGNITTKGLANWTGGKNLIWVDGVGMLDYAGYAHSAGSGLPQPIVAAYGDANYPSKGAAAGAPGISAVPVYPVSFNANPDALSVTDRAKDFQVSIDHTFQNKISLELAGQYSKFTTDGGNYAFSTIYLDVLQNLPNGQINPNYNKPYVNSFLGRNIDYDRDSKSARFVASYPLTFWGGTTNLSAFLLDQEKTDTTLYTDLHIVDPASTLSITDASSLIHVNSYLDNIQTTLPDFRSMYSTVDVPTLYAKNTQKTAAFEVAASGSYLHDTLSFIAGFRRDRSEFASLNGVTGTRDAKTGAFTTYTPDSRLGFNNTTTFGFVYFPLKHIGVYANHGEGFTIATSTNKALDGSFAKATIVPAKEESVGLRFTFGDTGKVKVIGSVGYYTAKQEHNIKPLGVGNINSLWRDLGLLESNDENKYASKIIETFGGDPYSSAAVNSINSFQSVVASGWEAQVTANVGNSFRLTVNGALPKTKQSASYADYIAYVTPNLPLWQPLATNTINSSDSLWINQVKSNIDSALEGRSQDKTYKYRANVFGIYTFNTATLKGLRLGGGAQFYGPCQISNYPGQPFNYMYAESYYLLTAQIGYPIKIGKYRADIQLNVDNLLGDDHTIYSGVIAQTLQGQLVNVPYGNKAVWPRSYRLTITIPF